jgi:hypothetical protein
VIAGVVFIVLAAALCMAALLGILGVTHLSMSGSAAIEHDGLPPGSRAPAWTLADADGVRHSSPPASQLQLVLFADHSLKSFPSVADGVRALAADEQLEVLLLLRQPSSAAVPVLRALGLGHVAVLTGSAALYADYNVRVGPFAIFVDSAGLVRSSSLVNHDWQLAKLRQLAALQPEPALPKRRSLIRRAARQPRTAV